MLLLDEATSALDFQSEHMVGEAIRSASVGRTTIIVSHQLSSITYADNIIVFSEGKVMEQGTHSELQALNGVYSKLFEHRIFLGDPARNKGCGLQYYLFGC